MPLDLRYSSPRSGVQAGPDALEAVSAAAPLLQRLRGKWAGERRDLSMCRSTGRPSTAERPRRLSISSRCGRVPPLPVPAPPRATAAASSSPPHRRAAPPRLPGARASIIVLSPTSAPPRLRIPAEMPFEPGGHRPRIEVQPVRDRHRRRGRRWHRAGRTRRRPRRNAFAIRSELEMVSSSGEVASAARTAVQPISMVTPWSPSPITPSSRTASRGSPQSPIRRQHHRANRRRDPVAEQGRAVDRDGAPRGTVVTAGARICSRPARAPGQRRGPAGRLQQRLGRRRASGASPRRLSSEVAYSPTQAMDAHPERGEPLGDGGGRCRVERPGSPEVVHQHHDLVARGQQACRRDRIDERIGHQRRAPTARDACRARRCSPMRSPFRRRRSRNSAFRSAASSRARAQRHRARRGLSRQRRHMDNVEVAASSAAAPAILKTKKSPAMPRRRRRRGRPGIEATRRRPRPSAPGCRRRRIDRHVRS